MKGISAEKIKEFGETIASIWGGELITYEINGEDNTVRYHCIEHGEEFFTDVSIEEIEKAK